MAQTDKSPLLKQLASSDPEAREAALASLRLFLTRPQPFTHAELLKLHKYLYYAVYMSDGPTAQQQLCKELASLVAPLPGSVHHNSLSDDNVIPFLRTFWQTIAREWSKLDRLRMDKYMLLIRLMLRGTFARVRRDKWDAARVKEHTEVLVEGPLNPAESAKIPRGITYHVMDCWLDEIENVAGEDLTDKDKRQSVPVQELLEPLRNMEQHADLKGVRKLARDALADERLEEWGVAEIEGEWSGLEE